MDKKKSVPGRLGKIALTAAVAGLGLLLLYLLASLNLLPAKLMIVLTITFLLIVAFFIIYLWLPKPYTWQKVVCTILALCLLLTEAAGSMYLYKAGDTLSAITTTREQFQAVAQVVIMKDSSIEDVKSLDGKTLGTLKYLDTQGSAAVLNDLADRGISVKEVQYEGLLDMVKALYAGKVDAVVINSSYRQTIEDSKGYEDFAQETLVIDAVTFYTQRTTSTLAVDDITQNPFIVLISGSDSRNGLEETARTDVNMLVCVNPITKTVLLVGIPRDYYVETTCAADADCPDGQMDKLTHTGLFGVDTTKKTIEKLLGITINYTLRVNFDSVVNLVDALGGIKVYVEEGLAVDSFRTLKNFSVTEGWNTLNGKQALAFSRERYAYLEGDRQRVKNQQIVLEAIAEKALSPAMLVQYNKFMDALSGAMETDISQDEIQALIKFQLNGNPKWTFYSYSLDGEGGTDLAAAAGSYAYVMYPDEQTVENAKTYIQAVMDGDDALLKSLGQDEEQTEISETEETVETVSD